ncbi:MAG TPA: iron ABC transporter permease [Advenella sp.]|nr:iron ABC transporter permease [Advenella sp.]
MQNQSRQLIIYRISWTLFLLSVLGFLIIYPIFMLGVGAVSTEGPTSTAAGTIGFDAFLRVVQDPNVLRVTWNTLVVCTGGTIIAVVVGLFFSWVTARTNTPFAKAIEATSIMPLLIPPLVAGVAWSILGSPQTGLLNVILSGLGLPFKVNFYTPIGIIVIFGIYYAPYVYMFTASAMKNMDPSLEEAAAISGVSTWKTIFQITLPLIMPAIIAGSMLSFVVMLGIYGIPATLGTPERFTVLTTYIYELLSSAPADFNRAAATSLILIFVTALAVIAQQRVLKGKSFVTVSGKAFKPRRIDLGRWRYVTLAVSIIYLFIAVVLPMGALVVGSLRKFLYLPNAASLFDLSAYSLDHFHRLFSNSLTTLSLVNTLKIGVITAIIGGILSFMLAYTIYRTKLPFRRLIDIISTLPIAIPGLVIGVAYIWAWISLPGGIYGSIWILALAFVARFIPDTVKSLSTSLLQIHTELEEASLICGRGRLYTIRKIILPLIAPGLVSSMSLLFILAIRELGSSLFLYSSKSLPMSVLLVNLYEGGNFGVTAAFSVVQTAILVMVVLFTTWLGRMMSIAK